MSRTIQTYNNIPPSNLLAFQDFLNTPNKKYTVVSGPCQAPDAIVLRSHKLDENEVPITVQAIGRAGAGVNNIPVGTMTLRGIPVFNTPGANANAVKELVLAALFMSARNLGEALTAVQNLKARDQDVLPQCEKMKKRYVGHELEGRTLGVIGLGAIGVMVANAASMLGMNVIGYDPGLTPSSAWTLSDRVNTTQSIHVVLTRSEFVTIHVPLVDSTRNLMDEEKIRELCVVRDARQIDATLINFSRNGIVDEDSVSKWLDTDNGLHCYVTDFPSNQLKNKKGVIALPHLGASTHEAERNCAQMVSEQIANFLENGEIRNSVNFPEVSMPRTEGCYRISVSHLNQPHMIERISEVIGGDDTNIVKMTNASRGDIAYTLMDLDSHISHDASDALTAIDGVLRIAVL